MTPHLASRIAPRAALPNMSGTLLTHDICICQSAAGSANVHFAGAQSHCRQWDGGSAEMAVRVLHVISARAGDGAEHQVRLLIRHQP